MILEIDQRVALPPYEQIRQQITALVRGGVLEPGTRLPPIRQLANDLGLAGGTVARAYRELEADGLVSARGRHGTVVAGTPETSRPRPEVVQAASRFAAEILRLGAAESDALLAVQAAFAARRNS